MNQTPSMYKEEKKVRCCHKHSWDLRTTLATFFLNCSLSSRHSFAASRLAALSSLGEESIEMIDTMIVSTCNHIRGLSVLTTTLGKQRSLGTQNIVDQENASQVTAC